MLYGNNDVSTGCDCGGVNSDAASFGVGIGLGVWAFLYWVMLHDDLCTAFENGWDKGVCPGCGEFGGE